MLDEESLRRPGVWDEDAGAWITLADGQDWLVPRTTVQFRVRYTDGQPALGVRSSLGPEFERKYETIANIQAGESPGNLIMATLDMGVWLLQHNYTLTLDECSDLVTWAADDETDLLNVIVAVINGRAEAPKRRPAGSA